jgi:hypothetical protein
METTTTQEPVIIEKPIPTSVFFTLLEDEDIAEGF